jgi:hypothetical protein
MRVLILKRHARQRPEGGREIDPTCWSMFDAIVFLPVHRDFWCRSGRAGRRHFGSIGLMAVHS